MKMKLTLARFILAAIAAGSIQKINAQAFRKTTNVASTGIDVWNNLDHGFAIKTAHA